jgi:hypothetical protein
MRRFAILGLVVVCGCVTQDLGPSSGKARFSDYPEQLIEAFAVACEGPTQSFRRPSQDVVECREILPPEPTAAIILQYDGTLNDLPELVIRFSTDRSGPDYVVSNDVFLNVPQKSGDAVQVRMESDRLQQRFDDLYRRAGGTLE